MSSDILLHWSADSPAAQPRRHECPLESVPGGAALPVNARPTSMSPLVGAHYNRIASPRKRGSALPEQGVSLAFCGGSARTCRDILSCCTPCHARSKRPSFRKIGFRLSPSDCFC